MIDVKLINQHFEIKGTAPIFTIRVIFDNNKIEIISTKYNKLEKVDTEGIGLNVIRLIDENSKKNIIVVQNKNFRIKPNQHFMELTYTSWN